MVSFKEVEVELVVPLVTNESNVNGTARNLQRRIVTTVTIQSSRRINLRGVDTVDVDVDTLVVDAPNVSGRRARPGAWARARRRPDFCDGTTTLIPILRIDKL
jgi:hypothetical protein